MAVNNSLTTKTQSDALSFEYESNNEKVKLSPATVRNYLVNGGGKVDDQEVMMFLTLCRYQHLNPFLKEVYLIKYGNSPATTVTGKDLFTKRANRNPKYAGKLAGIIVRNRETGEIKEREGTFFTSDTEELVGGWAKVFIKGHEQPEYQSVSFDEYAGRTKDGELNSQWKSKPGTMIRKVAVVQALREAFPEEYAGLYAPEEMGNVASFVLEDNAPAVEVAPIEEKPAPVKAETKTAPMSGEDIENALFGGANV